MTAAGLDCREWEGEVVVRVAHTGTTSLLSPAAGSVLLALAGIERPMDFDQLVHHVLGVTPADLSAEESLALRTTLDELARLSLVEVAAT